MGWWLSTQECDHSFPRHLAALEFKELHQSVRHIVHDLELMIDVCLSFGGAWLLWEAGPF